jgi:threonine dehydrogenase-like Zn-dependent dehydrogenase
MRAIAVFPGKSGTVHLADLKKPSVDDVPNGRGVLVRILKVGVDGTDKEINAAEYGAAPNGYEFLVIGHEGFGQVEEVVSPQAIIGSNTSSLPITQLQAGARHPERVLPPRPTGWPARASGRAFGTAFGAP